MPNPNSVGNAVAFAYWVIGCVYVFLFDYIVRLVPVPEQYTPYVRTGKGLLYILATALVLKWLLNRFLRRVNSLAVERVHIDTALRSALDRFPGPAAILDRHDRLVYANAIMLRILEIDNLENAQGSDADILTRETHLVGFKELLLRATSSGELVSGEVVWNVTEIRHYLVSIIPSRSGDGPVDQVITLGYDISDRKKSAIRAERQKRELRQIIDLLPSFVFAKDEDGKFILANEAFSRFHGMSPQQIIGLDSIILNGNDRISALLDQQDQGVIKNGQIVFQPRQLMVDSDGNERLFQITKIPFHLEEEDRSAVLGVALDITERLEQEATLLKIQARFRALIDHSLDALFVYDVTGRLQLVNERACTLLGRHYDEIVHHNIMEILMGDPSGHLEDFNLPLNQAGSQFQMVINGAKGHKIPVEIRVGRLPGDDDTYLAEMHDITDRLGVERERTTLSLLGVELSATRTPDEIAYAMAKAVNELLPVDAFYFAVKMGGQSRFRRIHGVDNADGESRYLDELEFEILPGSIEAKVLDGKPRLIASTRDAAKASFSLPMGNESRRPASMIYVPIIVGTRVLAIVSVQSYQNKMFSYNDLCVVQHMGEMVVPAMESARANRRARVFAQLGRNLGAAQTAEDVAQVIAEMADKLTGWDACVIALYSRAENNLTYIYLADLFHGQRRRIIESHPVKKPHSFSDRVLKEGAFLYLREELPDNSEFVGLSQNKRPSMSMIWVPIPGDDGPIGLISVQSYALQAFNNEDMENMKALADHCGAALNRTASQALLRYTEERYRRAIESTGSVAYQLDYAQQAYIFIGDQIEGMTGYTAKEMTPKLWKQISLKTLVDPTCEIQYDGNGQRSYAQWRSEVLVRCRNGSECWISDQAIQLRNSQGHAIGTLGILRDITEQKKVELALRASEERYALAARGVNDGLWDWNLETNKIHYSERWAEMLGISTGRLTDNPSEWFDRVHPQDIGDLNQKIEEHLIGESRHLECEFRIRHHDGDYCWMLVRGIAVRDESGQPTRMAGSQTDINDRVHTQERLLHDALHDPLTGLPNRMLLMEHLDRCLEHVRRRSGYQFALIFMDLDRFKTINDSLGHLAGDQVLVEVAQRLRLAVRPMDTIARFAGDEFAMILEWAESESVVLDVVLRVQAMMAEPIVIGHHEIITTVSAGIVMGSLDYKHSADILRDADNALYKSKALGTGRYCLFDSSMHENALATLRIEADLRRAGERDQLLAFFQPIVNLATGKIERFEALIRWDHPEWGLMLPENFLVTAEETGLIFDLDEWMLRESCHWLKNWTDAHGTEHRISVNLNLSPRHFLRRMNLAERFGEIVSEYGLTPDQFGLEITENALLSFHDETTEALMELKNMGFKIFLDDFGKGYSSLSYLHNFPFDMIKIDRHFVMRMQGDGPEREIIQAILMLTGKLKLGVVAEGVETQDQLEMVRAAGCDFAQGFFFSQPVEGASAYEVVHRVNALS